ncbi:hypothetical protein NC652_010660 [Populus alba x Populus x berolinensis]|nr:hypothetical protein NC652_010660 [Populus alba x Populus x berolinensis]
MEAVVAVLHKKEEKNQRYAQLLLISYLPMRLLQSAQLEYTRPLIPQTSKHVLQSYSNIHAVEKKIHSRSTTSINQISPLTNAFCNSPHRPVFRGPMVVTPCFRQVNSKPPTTMIKTPSIGIIRAYIHVFLEVPLLGGCSLNCFSAE